jgi:hypothetical protein
MLFRRIAFIGVMLAAVSAGVIQIRLMNAAAAREIHLLVAEQQNLQRQLWQQEVELARLRTPQRITDRLAASGTDFLPPGANRKSDLPPRQPADPAATPTVETSGDNTGDGATPSVTTNLTALGRHPGDPAHSWPSRPHNPKRAAH